MNKSHEEIYYCTHCGAANKKSAVECIECEKKINSKYRPFYDFLKNHTKEEGKDTAVNTVLGIIYRFLASHIYGIILTVSIVAAGVVTVQGMNMHITNVNTAPDIEKQTQVIDKEEPEFTESDRKAVRSTTHWYGNFTLRYRNKGNIIPYIQNSPFASTDEMLAEKNIPGYNYNAIHEFITNPIDLTAGIGPTTEQETHDWYAAEIISGDDVVTDTAKMLRKDGYEVAEVKYIVSYAIGEYDFDTHQGDVVAKAVCYMVMVCHEDNWYIAEDKLIEKNIFV